MKGFRRLLRPAVTLCAVSACCASGVGQNPLSMIEELPACAAPEGATGPVSFVACSANVATVPPVVPPTTIRTKCEFLESKARPSKGRTGLAGLFGLAN